MQKRFFAFMMIMGIIGAFILGFFSVRFFEKRAVPRQNLQQNEATAFNAEVLRPSDADLTQKYIGYITPINEVNVKPYISGFIEKIYVKGGEMVKKGDVLVVLKQDEYIAALKAADADILKAEAAYQNALTYLQRLKKAGKSVSASELENAEATYLSSVAALEQAKANYALAEVNYDYTLIRAPIDGVIGDVSLTRGNYVSPATASLFTIVQYNPIRVVFSISDKEYLNELNKKAPFFDEKLFLELPNGQIFKNEGVFQYTDNALDKKTTSIAVYADFKNIGKILTPNTYVTVLSKNVLKNTVSVAKNLVVLQDDGNFVYLIRKGTLIKAPVEILATLGETFVLKNTFKKGDAIVTDNVNEQNLGKPAEMIQLQKKV